MAHDLVEHVKAIEEKFRLLFDNSDDDIWIIDLQTLKFKYASAVSANIDGRSPGEMLGLSAEDILTSDFVESALPRLQEEIEKFLAGEGRTFTMTAKIIAKDGQLVDVDTQMRIFKDNGGLSLLGIARNPNKVMQIDKVENELEENYKQLLMERDRLRWEIKILHGLLPICSRCKKIRDDNGVWHDLETYLQDHSEANLTHTICPPCGKELYPGLKAFQNA